MIIKILTSPFLMVTATIILWIAFYLIFTKIYVLSETSWKRLEYLWISTGFLGLISIVNENQNMFLYNTSERKGYFIQSDIKMLKSTLSSFQTCFKFSKSEFSPNDFEERQNDQDKICNWSKTYQIELDSITEIPTKDLLKIDEAKLLLKTDMMNEYIEDFNNSVDTINKDLKEYKSMKITLESDDWKNFSRSFGVLFLIIAFSVRLAITTKNVVQTKKK